MFEQMQVQSTDVYRTITSGYSELAGMVMQNQKPLEISGKQEQAFKTSGRGMPKMNIRNAQQIIENLGQRAIVDGFINHPIHTFMQSPIWEDDLAMETCIYAYIVNGGLWKNDTTYESVMYLRDDLRSQYKEEFNLNQTQTDGMTFHDAYQYADAVYSERFEGIKLNADWNEDQIGMVNTT
tara:strand:- start:35 stop:577 length:543 start_codon:yes stop_codon:yes gene_type:complete